MIKKIISKYIIILLAMCAMCGAEYISLRPCGGAFCAALMYCGLPAIIIIPAYIIFSLLFDFSLAGIMYTFATVIAVIAATFLGMKFARAKRALFAGFLSLAQVSLLFRGNLNIITATVWAVLTLGVFVAAVCFLTPVLVKKLRYKLLETELVCGGVLLICVSLGLSGISVHKFDAAYFAAALCIPLAVSIGSVSAGVAVGMCFGAGIALAAGDISPIALFAFAALVSAVFTPAPRPIASLATSAAYVLAAYLFSVPPAWQQTVCFAVGALIFSCIPTRAVIALREYINASATAAAARMIVNRAAAETGKDLISASRIFDDMRIAMESVPSSCKLPPVLEKQVCSTCGRYPRCSAHPEYRASLEKMERASAEKGRASVSEVPEFLTECTNLSLLVGCASMSAQSRHEQILVSDARVEGRAVVARQLGLMSEVLRHMGERVRRPARFDTAKERKIADELAYMGAAVPEVIVTDENISVVVQSDDIGREQVERVLGKVTHTGYEFVRGGADVLPGYTLMLFEPKPRYDVAYSVSASPKEGRNGDNYSFVYLGGDRFMMTLCDGMGSGEEAEKASETAIELVESFFRAGLDSMSAVECVNRFLALNECERFTTLDITVIDLRTGDAEIIKLSSPPTVIRYDGGVRAVEGSSLPMGVLEEVTCGHASQKLKAGDEVIMATDGITDSLGLDRLLALSARASADPEAVTRDILGCALGAQNERTKDDCTVLCARIYEKRYK